MLNEWHAQSSHSAHTHPGSLAWWHKQGAIDWSAAMCATGGPAQHHCMPWALSSRQTAAQPVYRHMCESMRLCLISKNRKIEFVTNDTLSTPTDTYLQTHSTPARRGQMRGTLVEWCSWLCWDKGWHRQHTHTQAQHKPRSVKMLFLRIMSLDPYVFMEALVQGDVASFRCEHEWISVWLFIGIDLGGSCCALLS
jgi:hypothetical protein